MVREDRVRIARVVNIKKSADDVLSAGLGLLKV